MASNCLISCDRSDRPVARTLAPPRCDTPMYLPRLFSSNCTSFALASAPPPTPRWERVSGASLHLCAPTRRRGPDRSDSSDRPEAPPGGGAKSASRRQEQKPAKNLAAVDFGHLLRNRIFRRFGHRQRLCREKSSSLAFGPKQGANATFPLFFQHIQTLPHHGMLSAENWMQFADNIH